jgi:Flp pilus assembly protein CpaB
MVQTVKESFIKSQSEGKTLLDTLQVLRSTPLRNGLPTPAVILQRRNLRGGLLLTPQQLKSKNLSDTFVKEKLEQRQATQFFHSVGRKKYLSPLSVGNPVRVRVSKNGSPE